MKCSILAVSASVFLLAGCVAYGGAGPAGSSEATDLGNNTIGTVSSSPATAYPSDDGGTGTNGTQQNPSQ